MTKTRLSALSGALFYIFASVLLTTAMLFVPQKALAARATDENKANFTKIRRLYFLRDCVTYQLDDNGLDNDDNNSNPEFERYSEMYKSNGDRGTIGAGVLTDDGIFSCVTAGRMGMGVLLGVSADAGEQELMRTIWGQSITDNGGEPISVGDDDDDDISPAEVRANRDGLVTDINAEITTLRASIDAQALREMIFSSFAPMMEKCYSITTTAPSDANWDNEEGSFSYTASASTPAVTYYAQSLKPGWRELTTWIRNIDRIGFSNNDLYVGNVHTDNEGGWNGFSGDWFPVGNDIMFSLGVGAENGGGVGVRTQDEGLQPDMALMDCKYISDYKSFFLFDGQPNEVGWMVQDGALILGIDTNGDGVANTPEEQDANLTPGTLPPEDDDSCEANAGPLAWVMCAVIHALDAGIEYLDNQIASLLIVRDENFVTQEMKDTNAQIRNLAYLILVPIMLVMVIGTALGFEIMSAYSIKKAFPRMVAAIVFIALSSNVTLFLVQLTNTLGKGIAGLILGPLGVGSGTLASILDPNAAAVVGGTGVVFAVGAILALGPAVIGILLSYAFVTFIVLLLAFAILAVRQVLVLVLSLLAPLAILAWIFPGNDKLWKLWWGTFTKLLLMFPLIEVLVASGKVFSKYTFMSGSSPGSAPGPLIIFVAVTAYIAPYFFIPSTFKFAGGMFAAISGAATGRGKGLFERQKGFRAKTAGDAYRDFKSGTGSKGIRAVASRNVGRRIGAGWQGRYGLGARGKVAMGNQANIEPEELAKENPNFAKRMVDEDTMAALAMGNNVDKMMQLSHFRDHPRGRAYAEEVAARGRSVGNGTVRERVAAAKQLAKSGKVIQNQADSQALIASASGGDQSLGNDLKGSLQYTWRGVGRNDIGRDTLHESLAEMGVGEMGKLKPLGAAGMFNPERMDDYRYAFSDQQASPSEKTAMARNILAASQSQYLNPVQQASAKDMYDTLRREGMIDEATHTEAASTLSGRGTGDEANRNFNPPEEG